MYKAIQSEIEKRGYTYKEMSQHTGHSEAALWKLVNGESVKFTIIIDVIKWLLPDKEEELITGYSYNDEVKKPDQLKSMLEYYATNRYYDSLHHTINICINHKNKEIKQWGNFYYHLWEWKVREISDYDFFTTIRNFNCTCRTLLTLTKIVEMNVMYMMKNYNMIKELSVTVDNLLSEMDKSYLKKSFSVRISEMMSALELRINKDVDKSRKHALLVLEHNIGDVFNSFAYHTLGMSYLYESTEQMNIYFNKSLNGFKEHYNVEQMDGIKNRINKLNVIVEDSINQEYTPCDEDPLDMYIEGIRNNSDSHLFACLSRLSNCGDNYLAELPRQELLRKGVSADVIDSMRVA